MIARKVTPATALAAALFAFAKLPKTLTRHTIAGAEAIVAMVIVAPVL